ncbi:MAG: DUF4974 domain-containing protein [Pseudobacter sp.]|uniref:DUF4974 domain-containing protein n=1 Tax=Pseudobacter sp. TaxID=2045420 RepID=UPI003F804723
MDNNFEAYKLIRSKVLENQILLPEEQALWEEWKLKYGELMAPTLELNEVAATLKYMESTSCFRDFFEQVKQRASLELAIHQLPGQEVTPPCAAELPNICADQPTSFWLRKPFRIAISITTLVMIAGVFLVLKPEGSHGAGALQPGTRRDHRLTTPNQQSLVTVNKSPARLFQPANETVNNNQERFIFFLRSFAEIKPSLEHWYRVTIVFRNFNKADSSYRHTLDVSKDLPLARLLKRMEKSGRFRFHPRKTEFQKGDTVWITSDTYPLNDKTCLIIN